MHRACRLAAIILMMVVTGPVHGQAPGVPVATQWLWRGVGQSLELGSYSADSGPVVLSLTTAVATPRRMWSVTVADFSPSDNGDYGAIGIAGHWALAAPDSGFTVLDAGVGFANARGTRLLHIPVGIGTSALSCLVAHHPTRSWWT